MTKALITGANGFIGKALCARLAGTGMSIVSVVRSRALKNGFGQPDSIEVGGIDGTTDWQPLLAQVDVVIHLAARVHIINEKTSDALAEFRRVNVDGTIKLARQAALAGVRRFIFISSIKVNGETTLPGQAFTADDVPAPQDAYGVSKREAEDGLQAIAQKTGMELVIIRPPIVYGPGVKANFRTLMICIVRNIPLPLGAIQNKRSLLALDNLVDLILVCIAHPAAAQQIFLAADGEDLSTTEILKRMAQSLDKTPILLPIPVAVLKWVARMLGKQLFAQKLCDSLQVDISKTRQLLGWVPPVTVDQALRKTAQHFKDFS